MHHEEKKALSNVRFLHAKECLESADLFLEMEITKARPTVPTMRFSMG